MDRKRTIVAEVHEVAAAAHSAVAADYTGMNVADLTELRRQARAAGVYLRVVKNTLARRALRETPCECLAEHLAGPLLLAFSREEPAAAARLLRDFAREVEQPVVRMGALDNCLLSAAEVGRLAELPTRSEALARLAGTLLAPITALARVLQGPHAGLARLLAAIGRRKEGA